MLQALLFDLGSTLIYSEHDHQWGRILPRMRAGLWAALQAQGYADLDAALFEQQFAANVAQFDRQRQTDWVEYSTTWILQTTLQELGAPPLPPAGVAAALRAYTAVAEAGWQPMPQLHETLTALRTAGWRLGIISNASDDGMMQRLIDAANLRHYFDPILISGAVGVRKPNPKIFQLALDAWQLPPQACAMIGDTLGADILGAQLVGLVDIWQRSHADHPANRAHLGNIVPTHEVAGLAEIPALCEKLRGPHPPRS